MPIRESYTKVRSYIACPYQFYLTYEKRLKVPRNLSLILGSAVHKMVSMLCRLKKNPEAEARRLGLEGEQAKTLLYFTTRKKLNGFWWKIMWPEYCKGLEAKSKLVDNPTAIRFPEWCKTEKQRQDELHKFGAYGAKMLLEYYDDNENNPLPFLVEKSLTVSLVDEIGTGIKLIGTLDQARKDTKGRPYIIDLKSGFRRFRTEAQIIERNPQHTHKSALKRMLIEQLPLQEDLQLAIYDFLFEKTFGYRAWRLGFYFLKDREVLLIEPEKLNRKNALEVIRYVVSNTSRGYFPKLHDPRKCSYCDFFEACTKEQDLRLCPSVPIGKIDEPRDITILREQILSEITPQYKQLRLKLKYPVRAR